VAGRRLAVRRESRELIDRGSARAPARCPPVAPACPLAQIGRLQRTIGNRALARLAALREAVAATPEAVQRADAASVVDPEAVMASPLPRDLRRTAVSLIEQGRDLGQPDVARAGRELLATGQIAVRALRTNVMERPGFFGRAVDSLRRDERVSLLDSDASWYLVLSPNGITGWVHANRLFPRAFRLRPGDTGTGSTRGEAEIGGRG